MEKTKKIYNMVYNSKKNYLNFTKIEAKSYIIISK